MCDKDGAEETSARGRDDVPADGAPPPGLQRWPIPPDRGDRVPDSGCSPPARPQGAPAGGAPRVRGPRPGERFPVRAGGQAKGGATQSDSLAEH